MLLLQLTGGMNVFDTDNLVFEKSFKSKYCELAYSVSSIVFIWMSFLECYCCSMPCANAWTDGMKFVRNTISKMFKED